MTRFHFSLILLGLLAATPSVRGQEILTAVDFFSLVADRYAAIEDYTANVRIVNRGVTSSGTLFFGRPNRVRIDFTQPEEQVIVSDGEVLQAYIPRFNVVLMQQLRRSGGNAVGALATPEGLQLLRRSYGIAYLQSPEPVPLDDEDPEPVTKLELTWNSTREGYRRLVLSIDESLLIRRIEGVSVTFQEVQFDFADVRLNQGLPDARFEYEAPSSANIFNDFLFDGEG